MSVEAIKQFIHENKKGLIVGAIAALVIRAILR
jgi:predicted negative regulator of RcsB-dependent stress response